METNFVYDRVEQEIENLKELNIKTNNEYEEYIDRVYNPMSNPEVWAGERHDRNFEVIEKIKTGYENLMDEIRKQIEYLMYVSENYKNADNALTKSIDEWAQGRLGV